MTLSTFSHSCNKLLLVFCLSLPFFASAQESNVPVFKLSDPLQQMLHEEAVAPSATTPDGGFFNSWFQPENSPINIKEEALKALRHSQFSTAKTLFHELNRAGDGALSAYGLALLEAQQGNFDSALQKANQLYLAESDYQEPASLLRKELLLLLAQTAQIKNNFSAAEPFLKAYVESYGEEESLRFLRLAKAQGWSVPQPKEESRYPFLRIGVLLPLSGQLGSLGQDLLKSAQLALFANDSQRLLLYPEDTKGTPEGTKKALKRLDKLGVDVIVGPLLAENVDAATPFAKSNNTPVLALSSDAKVAGKNVFLMSYLPEDQARAAARYAVNQGRYSLATLTPDDDYGLEMANIFRNEAESLGVSLTTPIVYDAKSADITKPLAQLLKLDEAAKILEMERKLLEAEFLMVGEAMDDVSLTRLRDIKEAEPVPIIEFDALFIPASAQSMPLVASQLAFYDVDPRSILLLGTARWHDKAILQNRGEYLGGARFIAPSKGSKSKFDSMFSKTYGETPQALSLLVYDAVYIFHQLTKTLPNDKRFILKALKESPVFYGLSGGIRFLENGLNRRSYDIAEITSKGFKRIEMGALLPPPPLPEYIDAKEQKSGSRSLFDFWD